VKPGIDQLLAGLVTTIATRIIPELNPTSYALGDAKMSAVLAMFVAQEADRAADTYVRENREMRMLFLAASQMDLLPALRVRLAHDAALEESDLKLATLSALHDRHSETLIVLHATVETIDAEWARSLSREICQFLLRAAESRLLVMPAM
jgi:hypothetical protein